MALAKEQEGQFNQAAASYLAGHGRNFLRSMNPRNTQPLEKVQPWGEARAAALNPPPAAVAPAGAQQNAQPAPVTKQPVVPVLGNQSKVAVAGGAPAAQPAAGQQQQAFRSLLGNGLTMTGDMQGNRTYTMGTPGQDGYGMMTVRGGQNAMGGQSSAAGLDLGAVARQNLQGRGQVSGYSFEGGGADFAKFAQQPTRPAMQDGNTSAYPGLNPAFVRIREQQEAEKAAKEQLAGLDPRSGWGWKGRQDLYKHQQGLDQRDREVGTRAMMDAAQLQAGQQQAAAALAQGDRQFNAEQQGRDVDMQAKQLEIQSEQKRQEIIKQLDTTTDPNERRALQGQLLAMQGKDPAQKYQVVTREGFDPVTNMPTKTPYAVNQDDPTQSFEIRGQGGQENTPLLPPSGQRVVGQTYRSPTGKTAVWDGKGLVPQ
jgi:hypothetical protein